MSVSTIDPRARNIESIGIYIPKLEIIINNAIYIQGILNIKAEVNVISRKLIDQVMLAIKTRGNLYY